MTKSLNDFVRVRLRPQEMKNLLEVTADQIGKISQDQLRLRIDLTNPEVCIYQVDAKRRAVEKRLKLLRSQSQAPVGLFGLRRQSRI
jgi:hypothetical protein